MKAASLVELVTVLYTELVTMGSTTYQQRDVEYIKRRHSDEGLSFLTITLPSFCDDVFTALENGVVTSDLFRSFRKRKRGSCLPAFLQGFTGLVFAEDGRVKENVDTFSLFSVRQICYLVKKIKVACTDERTKKAFDQYKRTECDLSGIVGNIPAPLLEDFTTISRCVVEDVFPDLIDTHSLVPHHGPGSTAEGIKGNKKYLPPKAYPARLSQSFDFWELYYNSEESYYNDRSEDHVDTSVFDELPVRVIAVPKTLKTPRIIAMEPCAMQMAQQGVKEFFVERLENADITKGHINFRDQGINQQLALENSRTRELATLDMSEASDRVLFDMVSIMLTGNTQVLGLVTNTRSRYASLPDGSVLELIKFASMGSALCFPVESLFFFIVMIQSALAKSSLPPTRANIYKCSRDIYVYGDDIIVPADVVDIARHLLASYGSKVNDRKSFVNSSFRESCGCDAYNGTNITPIYVRYPMPSKRCEASALVSLTSTANQFFNAGLSQTATFLKDAVESVLGELPSVNETCAGLGWVNWGRLTRKRVRHSKKYHRLEVLTYVPTVVKKKDVLVGYSALNKVLRESQFRPSESSILASPVGDPKHLSASPRRGCVTLKRRWVAPY